MSENLEWYLNEVIKAELTKLKEGRFTGNIEFRVNYKEGSIANCNVGLNKSIRKIEKP